MRPVAPSTPSQSKVPRHFRHAPLAAEKTPKSALIRFNCRDADNFSTEANVLVVPAVIRPKTKISPKLHKNITMPRAKSRPSDTPKPPWIDKIKLRVRTSNNEGHTEPYCALRNFEQRAKFESGLKYANLFRVETSD